MVETWYAYRQELKFDFAAKVRDGTIYSNPNVRSQDLLQIRLPVEPPVYRRVLVSKLTDTVRLEFPYTFLADRPAKIKARYSVDGSLTVPGLWQRPYPLMPVQEVTVESDQLVLDKLIVEIPVKQVIAELDSLSQTMKLAQDQAEIRVRPQITIEVEGQKEPVSLQFNKEIVVAVRGTATAIEVDEPKTFTDEKQFTESKILPATMNFLGFQVEMASVRRLSIIALSIFALVLAILLLMQWFRANQKDSGLKGLGSALIVARGLDLPSDAAMVDVRTVQQLVQLHLQTNRPVIKVGNTYYLLDGATCYRLRTGEEPEPPVTPA